MPGRRLVATVVLLMPFMGNELARFANADDWPQFLGLDRTGVSSETGLLSEFSATGPQVVWKVPGGVGMSGIAVANGHAVTMWNDGQNQRVVSLDPANGNILWSTPFAPAYENSMGDGPRATPTIANSRVYAYGGGGQLICLNLADGNIIWKNHLPSELNSRAAEYGMASSPLVTGDQVVVTCGGRNSAVVSVQASTGKLQWSSVDGAPGYASVSRLKVAGNWQLVSFTGAGVTGLDVKDGRQLWKYPFKTPYDCNTASPISVGDSIFISAGENHGCVLLDVKAQPKGGFAVTERWSSIKVKSVMRNEWQTSILLDGYLYGFDNVGSAGPTTHLTCIHAATGEVQWRKTRFGKGNLVAADGKLWITMMSGELVLVDVDPTKFNELGRARMFGKTRQTLAISNGRGFIRDDQNVICLSLKK